MTSRVVDYQPAHLHAILGGELNHAPAENTLVFGQHAQKLQVEGGSYTYIVNGYPVVCGGVAPLWPGVGEGWVVAGQGIYDHGIQVARGTRQLLTEIAERQNLHRIQSAVLDNNPKLERFARFVGFTPEGVLRRYGTDRTDYTLYSRLFHG